MTYKITEQQAHKILYSKLENVLIPSNFTDCHSQYSEAIEFTKIYGYFDMNDFNIWLTI